MAEISFTNKQKGAYQPDEVYHKENLAKQQVADTTVKKRRC